MFSSDNYEPILRKLMSNFGIANNHGNKDNCCDSNERNGNKEQNGSKELGLSTSQMLVIAGILGGVLNVESILIDKQQVIQIVLEGSLKRKTKLDKMMEEISSMPFDEVMKAMLNSL